jgi:hypothetical protein
MSKYVIEQIGEGQFHVLFATWVDSSELYYVVFVCDLFEVSRGYLLVLWYIGIYVKGVIP